VHWHWSEQRSSGNWCFSRSECKQYLVGWIDLVHPNRGFGGSFCLDGLGVNTNPQKLIVRNNHWYFLVEYFNLVLPSWQAKRDIEILNSQMLTPSQDALHVQVTIQRPNQQSWAHSRIACFVKQSFAKQSFWLWRKHSYLPSDIRLPSPNVQFEKERVDGCPSTGPHAWTNQFPEFIHISTFLQVLKMRLDFVGRIRNANFAFFIESMLLFAHWFDSHWCEHDLCGGDDIDLRSVLLQFQHDLQCYQGRARSINIRQYGKTNDSCHTIPVFLKLIAIGHFFRVSLAPCDSILEL
jgi:hypothetical protein